MSPSKLHKTLKKYKELHKKHVESWEKDHLPKIKSPLSESHRSECHSYAEKGNNLLKQMMGELEGLEVFPKKTKQKP